jgi:hypothetical protein
MTGFCLGVAFAVVYSTIPAETLTLSWTHSVEKTRWEEDYIIRDGRLVLVAARVQGSGAGMEPGHRGVRRGDWWEYRPDIAPQSKITLANSAFTDDYRLCAPGDCRTLASWLSDKVAPGKPVDLFPCPTK